MATVNPNKPEKKGTRIEDHLVLLAALSLLVVGLVWVFLRWFLGFFG